MLLRRHQLCPIVMRSSAKTAWMSQQLLLLLLLLATTTFKQSEQRVLASKEGEADNNKDLLAAAEEGPEVVLPPFDYVPYAAAEEDDVLGASSSSSSSFSQRLANAKARFIANQLAKAAGLAEELRPRTQRWLLRTEALKDHSILGAGGIGPGGLQWSKRVVSESELNSLLKNAWLGRK